MGEHELDAMWRIRRWHHGILMHFDILQWLVWVSVRTAFAQLVDSHDP